MNRRSTRFRRLPYPTVGAMIAIAAGVLLIQELFELRLPERFGTVPREFRDLWSDLLAGRWGVEAAAVVAKLFTPLFLHGDVEHLLGNMIFLWAFGTLCAGLLGNWWAVGLFLCTGAIGNLLQISLNPHSPIPIIGASGAVCGFEGAYLGLALRWQLDWPDVWPLAHPIPPLQLAAFAGIGILFDIYSLHDLQQPIAYGAHVGGFFAGLILVALMTQIYPTREAWGKGGGE